LHSLGQHDLFMRHLAFQNERAFLVGFLAGLLLVVVKLVLILPVDVADLVYGTSLLLTLVITFGDLVDLKLFVAHSKGLDFVLGLLFPLDCFAVLILFGAPLPN
jgi:hypothetical protein